MKTVFRVAAFMALAAMGGCSAVYFYETEKASVNLEARADPTAPVTGSIGVKQRVVLVTPSTDNGKARPPGGISAQDRARLDAGAAKVAGARAAAQAAPSRSAELARAVEEHERLKAEIEARRDPAGDALSVLSSFRFRLHPREQGQLFSRMTIDGALITGQPAKDLSPAQARQAVGALTGVASTGSTSTLLAIYALNLNRLQDLADAGAPGTKAILDQWAVAARLIPAVYPIRMYSIGNESPFELDAGVERGSVVPSNPKSPWADVVNHLALLNKTREALAAAVNSYDAGQKVTMPPLDGVGMPITITPGPATAFHRAGLASLAAEANQQYDAFAEALQKVVDVEATFLYLAKGK